MKKKTVILTAVMVLVISLVLLNRDLFSYSYDTLLEREFTPETDAKRDYLLLGPVTLKPGSYILTLELNSEGYGSGIMLVDGNEDNFYSADLPYGETNPSFCFDISGETKQIRFGIRYDPQTTSSLRLERVRITADHIVYRESILRHAVLSLLLIITALLVILRICFPETLWKLFPAFSRRKNEIALLMLVCLTAAACYPLFNGSSYVRGEDMFFHITRIRGLADSLQAGYFPVRDQLYWLNNYGYGVGFYYPDTFLYFPALMVLLGFDLLTAYKVFLVICSFLSIAAAWYAGLRISKNRTAAAASAVFFAFAAYRLSNVYYRGAVGETQAAVFYPLIILGLYEIFFGNREHWLYFAFGFLGLFSCHIISLVIGVLLTFLFLLTQIRKMIRRPEILIPLLKSVLLVAGIGAFFWMPMLEQSLTNPGLRINNVLEGSIALNTTNYAFPVQNLLSRFKTWNFAWQADCIYPGWSLLLVPLLGAALWNKRTGSVKTADFLLLFSLPVIWMCTRAFPWQWEPFLPFVIRIQFAYRLLLPASVMLSLSGGIYFSQLIRERNSSLWLSLLTLFCFFSTAFSVLQESFQNRTVDKRLFVMQDNRVSGGEYMPLGLDNTFPGKNADTVLITESDTPLTVTSHKRQKLGFSFEYEINEEDGPVHFSIPLIYYTGYQGSFTAEDGTVLKIPVGWDSRGLVNISGEGLSRGKITVQYRKTTIQYIGEALTLLSICLLIYTDRQKFKDKIHFRRL